MFAATAVTQENNSNLIYQVTAYTWANDVPPFYLWNEPFQLSCSMSKTDSGGRPYVPTAQVQGTGMVASGPYLLRFNGEEWLVCDLRKECMDARNILGRSERVQ